MSELASLSVVENEISIRNLISFSAETVDHASAETQYTKFKVNKDQVGKLLNSREIKISSPTSFKKQEDTILKSVNYFLGTSSRNLTEFFLFILHIFIQFFS